MEHQAGNPVADPGGSDAVFELRDAAFSVELREGRRDILAGVDFSLAEGEILGIVGPSGTGKTSLIRIIAGLAAPTAGLVRFRGEPVLGPPEGVAVVFQDYANALLQWRTVAANVALGIERRFDRAECARRVARCLALVGLERHADDYPWQLSGGMQQRVQIARALALEPTVLLMDEPFASLDAMTKAGLQDELLRLRAQTGTSVVFITHDIEEAIYLGDRVAVLRGRPGTIAETHRVELGRERDQVLTREQPAFLQLRHRLHAAIGAHD
jgi:NitT/TauT family transport system ATP-binding protein